MEKEYRINDDFNQGRYALRVAVDLAQNQADGYLPLKAIAERQEISLKYLEAIISALVRAELVSGVRGRGGGYRLAKNPEQITVGSILHLTEGSLARLPVWIAGRFHAAVPRIVKRFLFGADYSV